MVEGHGDLEGGRKKKRGDAYGAMYKERETGLPTRSWYHLEMYIEAWKSKRILDKGDAYVSKASGRRINMQSGEGMSVWSGKRGE